MDCPDFQCSNCLLAEDYSGEVATLRIQVAHLHKLLGNPRLPGFSFSSTQVAGRRSGLVEVSQESLPKGGSPSLVNGARRMLLDDLGDVPVLDPTNQPWQYVRTEVGRVLCRSALKSLPTRNAASGRAVSCLFIARYSSLSASVVLACEGM